MDIWFKNDSYPEIPYQFNYNHFWRTYEQQEIDWVEERNGSLFAYEFKWKEDQVKIPTQWKNAYPDSSFEVINNSNFEKWLEITR